MKIIDAAGALPWRVRDGALEVLLIHRPTYGDWSWPKGKPAKRETLPACAIREVEEETGAAIKLGAPLPSVSYRLSTGERKVNRYWAGEEARGRAALEGRPPVVPAPAHEVDDAAWVDAVTALAMLTRRSDREPLKALLDLYADDRLRTWAVLLTRHATAKKRAAWDGGEHDRPLTPGGHRQAARLVPLFAAFGVEH